MKNENDGANESSPTTRVLSELARRARETITRAFGASKTRPRGGADARTAGQTGRGRRPVDATSATSKNTPETQPRLPLSSASGTPILLVAVPQVTGTDTGGSGIHGKRDPGHHEVSSERFCEVFRRSTTGLRFEAVDGSDDAWISTDHLQEVRR